MISELFGPGWISLKQMADLCGLKLRPMKTIVYYLERGGMTYGIPYPVAKRLVLRKKVLRLYRPSDVLLMRQLVSQWTVIQMLNRRFGNPTRKDLS